MGGAKSVLDDMSRTVYRQWHRGLRAILRCQRGRAISKVRRNRATHYVWLTGPKDSSSSPGIIIKINEILVKPGNGADHFSVNLRDLRVRLALPPHST